MAKLISMKALERHLRYRGPYIFFYDKKSGKKNAEIIEHMNIMANKYSKLKVFIVIWEDKKKFLLSKLLTEGDKIYLYYLGLIREMIYLPDTQKINELFFKAIEFFNDNIERKAQNIGKRPCINYQNDTNQNPAKPRRKCHLRENNIVHRKTYMLKQKIQILHEFPQPPKIIKNKYSSPENLLACEKLISRRKTPFKYNKNEGNIKIPDYKIQASTEWFNDAAITNLPTEIISTEFEEKN